VPSSRRLEAETHRNTEVIWLLRHLKPDFKTIADFRRVNRSAVARSTRACSARMSFNMTQLRTDMASPPKSTRRPHAALDFPPPKGRALPDPGHRAKLQASASLASGADVRDLGDG